MGGQVFGETLFDINAEMENLDAVFDVETLTDEERETVILEYLNASGRLADKADNYAALIARYQAAEVANKNLADKYASTAKALGYRISWMKRCLLSVMQQQKIKKLPTERFELTVAGNGGKQPMEISPVFTNNVELLPERFINITKSIATDELRTALESGEVITAENPFIPGEIIPIAKLNERGVSLRIKEKAS